MASGKESAGLLMYRRHGREIEVFLAHLGGPFWAKKDEGGWDIPKGELRDNEDKIVAAEREFEEETSFKPKGPYEPLGTITTSSGKTVFVWAFEGDCDPSKMKSNCCEIEWPPRSGKKIQIPEMDRGAFFSIEIAKRKVIQNRVPFLERLEVLLSSKNV